MSSADAEFIAHAPQDVRQLAAAMRALLTVADRLDEIEARARLLYDESHPHEGDCGDSLCATCGCCLHSSDPCDCRACKCHATAVELPRTQRDTLELVAAFRAALAI